MKSEEDLIKLHSGAYVEMYERKPLSRLQRLVPMMQLTGNERIADFACGNAMLLPLISDKVRHYDGIDFSEDFIGAAKRRAEGAGIKNCSFHCQDILAFCDQHPATFDVATAFDFSEHVYDDDAIRFFAAIRSSLRQGGRFYLHTPNLAFFMERFKDIGIIPQFPEHIAVRGEAANIELLVRAGFERDRIRCHRIAHYNLLKLLHPLHRLPLVGDFFSARLFIECLR